MYMHRHTSQNHTGVQLRTPRWSHTSHNSICASANQPCPIHHTYIYIYTLYIWEYLHFTCGFQTDFGCASICCRPPSFLQQLTASVCKSVLIQSPAERIKRGAVPIHPHIYIYIYVCVWTWMA